MNFYCLLTLIVSSTRQVTTHFFTLWYNISSGTAGDCWRKPEESPGCNEARFHLTDGWGNPRASATESRLPYFRMVKGERVR